MNPLLAYKIARTGWDRFSDYRAKKAEEAYAALEEIAKSSVVRDIRAGAVTQAAHERLEKQLTPKATKKKKQWKKFGFVAGIIAVLATGSAVYYWLRKNDVPAAEPPRVEDFAEPAETPDSVLVYSTETEN